MCTFEGEACFGPAAAPSCTGQRRGFFRVFALIFFPFCLFIDSQRFHARTEKKILSAVGGRASPLPRRRAQSSTVKIWDKKESNLTYCFVVPFLHFL